MILPDISTDEAFVITERNRCKIENHSFNIYRTNINVTVSGGISEYPGMAANDVEIVKYAYRAMYICRNRAKAYNGKIGMVFKGV